jgi:ribosomal-protein-alanine N-acetyltransferase
MGELVGPVIPAGSLGEQAQPRITGDGVALRPWGADDVPALTDAFRDPSMQQWHARSMDEGEARAWIDERVKRWGRETGVDWAVLVEDVVVGRMGFRELDLREGRGEAAYWVVPSWRGQGIAARALGAASDWMFREGGFHRLELSHSVSNEASCRVAERAGYRGEGIARQQVLHPDGWHDMHLHARLAAD